MSGSARPPLVLYHADCDDGFGAAYAAWLSLGDDATYQPVHHGDVVASELLAGRQVFILDFSFSPEIISTLSAVTTQIVLLDHHKSAAEQWQGVVAPPNTAITFDMERSGAQMSWDYFHPGVSRPPLIDYIADRDLWRFALPGTREFCAGLSLQSNSFPVWRALSPEAVMADGRVVAAHQQRQIERILRSDQRPITLLGHQGLAANIVDNTSEIGHRIALRSGTFALLFSIKGDRVMCSLRSLAPFDVSEIAKHYGGGGHAQAAGFRMPIANFFAEIWR